MIIYSKKNKNLKICEIIKFNSLKEGNNFYSDHDDYLQISTITQNKGFEVQPHIHIENSRKISKTQEVWILIEGKITINFYDIDESYLTSNILEPGDISILYNGGHSIEKTSKKIIMYEIKNGPYDQNKKDKKSI